MASSSGSANSMSSFDTLLPLLSADPGPFKPDTFFVEPHLKLILDRHLQLIARHEHIAGACRSGLGDPPGPVDAQELGDVGVPKLGGRRFGQSALPCKLQNLVALVAEPNPFIQQTVPLALQFAHGPALLKAVEFVKSAPS